MAYLLRTQLADGTWFDRSASCLARDPVRFPTHQRYFSMRSLRMRTGRTDHSERSDRNSHAVRITSPGIALQE